MLRAYVTGLSLLAFCLLGIFLFIYGALDDSPGGQLLGLVIIIVSLAGLWKQGKKFSAKKIAIYHA